MQFDFGQNWLDFSNRALTSRRITEARMDFRTLFSGIDLKNKKFLDIGFGQGLSLLFAKEAGAEVYGNVINPKCRDALERTASIMGMTGEVPVIVGSILDNTTIQQLKAQFTDNGLYEIVHSWGVLHHTGNMKLAVKNALSLVKDDGYFICAVYNKHITSKLWVFIKWLYCISPSFVKKVIIAIMYPVIFIAKSLVTLKNPLNMMRGMDFYYNIVDWVGGYPYEYASLKEMIELVEKEGFSCIKKVPAEVPTGCNEYVFVKENKINRISMPDNRSIYNENWVEWENMKRYGPMSRHTQRLVRNVCKQITFSSLLDVGCGPGVFLSVMNKSFNNLKLGGTDISSIAIRLAKSKFPDAEFFEADISTVTIDGSWDLVTMIDVAEHIENDEAAFVNIHHFCRKYLLVVTLEGRMRPFEPQIGHVRNYKKGELQEKLVRSGYTIVKTINWGWPMYSPIYRNLSQTIDAHKKSMTLLRRIMTHLAYSVLAFNVPHKGDLVIVLATPVKRS